MPIPAFAIDWLLCMACVAFLFSSVRSARGAFILSFVLTLGLALEIASPPPEPAWQRACWLGMLLWFAIAFTAKALGREDRR